MPKLSHRVSSAWCIFMALGLITSCNQKPKARPALEMVSPKIEILTQQPKKSALPLDTLSACAGGPGIPFVHTSDTTHQSTWRTDVDSTKNQIFMAVHQNGLTLDDAVRLALVNNPDLLAYYENLEVGHAEVLEAGLRQNPVFKRTDRFPDERRLHTNVEVETMTDFLDYFLVPFRQHAAEADLAVIESEFRQKVIDLGKDVEDNWISVRALEIELDHHAQLLELREIAEGLAGVQQKAGNVSALSARKRVLAKLEVLGKISALQADLAGAREKLYRSLGLFGPQICFSLAGELVANDDGIPPHVHDLERAAIANRQDLEALRRTIVALAEEAKLKDPWTYAKLLVGTSFEQDTDGVVSTGPSIELEMPIFNQGQAQQQKYHALIAQAQKQLLAKAVEACSEVREFLKTAAIHRALLNDLETTVLPNWKKQNADGLAHYNAMTLGVFDLLDLKEGELQASIDHAHALTNYLKAQVALMHAVGGSFVAAGGAS